MEKSKKKHIIYFIGGPARAGKTTIGLRIIRRKHLVPISTDATRSAVRNVLIGESHVSIREIKFKTTAKFQRPGSLRVHNVTYNKANGTEDGLTWDAVLGLIDTYDRANKIDVLVEGIAVTPERIHALKLKNLDSRAVFVGYGNESHIASILAYSKKRKDWVYTWIREHGGDDAHVKKWVKGEVQKSRISKKMAKKFGYGYFDIAEYPFEKYISKAVSYLLKNH